MNIQLTSKSVLVALATSLGVSALIALAFCFLRPFNSVVYAPRLRFADAKHKPPELGPSPLAWIGPLAMKEDVLVEKIGLDATIFLRFTNMCRNIFLVLSLVGCGILIPVNVVGGKQMYNTSGWSVEGLMKMTPQYMYGGIFWAFVGCAYAFNTVVMYFLWRNYKAVTRLRRAYLDSPEYQTSLSSRTLMVTDIPKSLRTDEGIVRITDDLKTTPEVPRAAIGRNVKDLPNMIEEHEEIVMKLEKVLAKYLKNPNKLPATRPTCKPSKKDEAYVDKNTKVDAIEYLAKRIERLEREIRTVRESVDRRDAMPYGFASYESIESAHSLAYLAKRKHPQGTTIRLAPRPNDIIWKNLPLDPKTRRWRRLINNVWITLLTLAWMAPNALIAVFLTNLSNLGNVWHGFKTQLEQNPNFWAVVQGVASPAITSLFYYLLPSIFRRLSIQAGDVTKTSRERHVINKLYSFFVFNNLLVFSLFSALWAFIGGVIEKTNKENKSVMDAFQELHPLVNTLVALCSVSPFWITWLLQRNLGAAIDLAQVANLAWGSFRRKFGSPTPRDFITQTAPPPFDYASYYNYFLFYSTVTLAFAPIQPVVLLVTALYFCIDAYWKKYLLMYVFVTKTESGGLFWRVLFNRMLFTAFFSNLVVVLMVVSHGDPYRWQMLAAMIPLPLMLLGFKIYCKRTFDDQLAFYTKGESHKGVEAALPVDKESRRRDRVGVRFGNPALYKKLIVPMVHEKSQHLLAELYKGRLHDDGQDVSGYSDVYAMKRMSHERPGKAAPAAAAATAPFEIVKETELDFENFKDRPEFSEEHGGGGEAYGRSADVIRPGTPGSLSQFGGSERGRSESRDSERTYAEDVGVQYPKGYHSTPSALREYSPSPERGHRGFENVPVAGAGQYGLYQVRDETALLGGAAPMGRGTPYERGTPGEDGEAGEYFRGRQF
ncbi:DUF221-domain-containing protein [Mytilinidion resinicola]|uniref:DUF221-domain-containing protein n=1 Tax=Mytilinidion resinicola TaxID=574789 RepID=A0A6A6Z2J9_9PEZI|nr:DUF221-domain-containing protein [Mytilinidion resinicola]KAF2814457.1 DUF221-domain-containing protein [Mytilinidion resinicola]